MLDVLHLVDEDRDPDAEVAGQVGDVGEQLDQVELEVAGVGAAPHRRHVGGRAPADLLAVRERGPQREGLHDARDRVDPVGVAVPVGDLADGGVHRLRERQPQRLVGTGLELAGPPGPLHREPAQRVEQHGLADPAQPGEHHRALGAAGGDPLEGDLELPQLPVAAGELGRPLAGAGGVGVPDRVHAGTVSARLA